MERSDWATMRHKGLLGIMILVALVGATVHFHYEIESRFPPNSLPWQPVALDAKPNWLARWQIRELNSDGETCRAALTRARIDFTPLADRRMGTACQYTDVVKIDDLRSILANRPPGRCGLLAAFHWYEGLLKEAAKTYMRTELQRVDHVGVYACRNINREKVGSRSEHATANAIDVTAFRFADGRVATVTSDYGKNTPEGKFLQAARGAACMVFNGVLGPDYNRLHKTHLHLDMGPYLICR